MITTKIRYGNSISGSADPSLWQVTQIEWHDNGYATVEIVNNRYCFIAATAENVPAKGLLDRLSAPDRHTTLANLMEQQP